MISRDTYIALTKFGIVGGLSFFVDLSVYYGLSQFIATWMAKSAGIIVATYVNYQLNKHWTWGASDLNTMRLAKYLLLYTLSGSANVISNELLLAGLPKMELNAMVTILNSGYEFGLAAVKIHKFVAVIAATALGMVINFLGQKIWVFKAESEE